MTVAQGLNKCDCVKFETPESSSPLGYHAVSAGKWLFMFQWDSLFPHSGSW